jgi:hypothetical protein
MKERRLSSWGEMRIWRSGEAEAKRYIETRSKPGDIINIGNEGLPRRRVNVGLVGIFLLELRNTNITSWGRYVDVLSQKYWISEL